MSEIDVQKEQVSWYKDLFKWVLAAILALTAGLISLIIGEQVLSVILYLGILSLSVLVGVAFILARKVQQEIEKLRDL
jgi:hypothetical protein